MGYFNEKGQKKIELKGQLWRIFSDSTERDVVLVFFTIGQRDMAVAIG